MAQIQTHNPQSVHLVGRSANPLIQGNVQDTIAATRDYVADMANAAALDDQLPRGGCLRLLVVLSALDSLVTENLYHK